MALGDQRNPRGDWLRSCDDFSRAQRPLDRARRARQCRNAVRRHRDLRAPRLRRRQRLRELRHRGGQAAGCEQGDLRSPRERARQRISGFHRRRARDRGHGSLVHPQRRSRPRDPEVGTRAPRCGVHGLCREARARSRRRPAASGLVRRDQGSRAARTDTALVDAKVVEIQSGGMSGASRRSEASSTRSSWHSRSWRCSCSSERSRSHPTVGKPWVVSGGRSPSPDPHSSSSGSSSTQSCAVGGG